uniref:Uncharacterized protein n=1 Tax=Solanum tuberosum TaxID=4113 RepID=M1DMA7_SOLTU
MRAEMDKTRDLTNLAIVANTPTLDNRRPTLNFPTSDPTSDHFPNNSSTSTNPKSPIIDLTTLNPHHASSSHQKLPTLQNPNTNIFQNFPSVHQTPTQIVQNPPTTQPIPQKTACHNSISPESYPQFTTHFELDDCEKKEKEWKVIKGKDLIDQIIVTLQAVISNANGNSLLNRGGFVINMIDPKFQAPPRQNTLNYRQMPSPQQGSYDSPRSCLEKKPARNFTPLIESWTKLFEQLSAAGIIHPVKPKPVLKILPSRLKDLINQKVVRTVVPSVNSNPLLNYGGATINMIETEDEWCMVKAIVPIGLTTSRKL